MSTDRVRRSWARPEVGLVLAAIASSALVWWPYRGHMDLIYRHWDAPSYLQIAAEGYRSGPDGKPPMVLAHLPLYPATARVLGFLGLQRALLAATVLATVAAVLLFYRLARDVWRTPSPAFLSLVFLLVPPRWWLYHGVGASEPLYIALVLAAIWCLETDRIAWSCAAAGLAAITRTSGIMMLPAWALLLELRGRRRSMPWLLLIPAGFAAYLVFAQVRFGDFMAPFAPNLDKISSPIPFSFLGSLIGVNHIAQAEFYIYLAFVYALGITRLREYPIPMVYAAFQLAFYVCIGSEDWSRYFLAMAPFALVLGFRDLWAARPARWLIAAYVPVALYYCWNSVVHNLIGEPQYIELLRRLPS